MEYPKGGLNDCAGSFSSEKDAHDKGKKMIEDKAALDEEEDPDHVEAYYHILDIKNGMCIEAHGDKTSVEAIFITKI